PAVVVPGLSAGPRSQVFPARPRQTTRWTENPRLLPFGLRGDQVDLPGLAGVDPASVPAFTEACAGPGVGGERAARDVGGPPAAVVARLFRLLVGRWRTATRALGVPGGDRGRMPAGGRAGGLLGVAART